MTVTYGFYNSLAGDRIYDAIQVSKIFDGLISDGIYDSIGTGLVVSETTGMVVSVGIGRAWFDYTWTLNDAALPLTVEDAEAVLNRIDAVVLEIDSTSTVRVNSIKIIEGTPASSPVAPTMIDTETVHQYALAHIDVDATVTEILAVDITNKVGTVDTPFVTGIVESIDVATWLAQVTAEIDAWFDTIKDQLSTEAETALYLRLERIEDVNEHLMTGTLALDDDDLTTQLLDPDGSDRVVALPDEHTSENHPFTIINAADADGEVITVKDYAQTTIHAILERGESATFISSGTAYSKVNVSRKTISMHKPLPTEVVDTFMRIPIPGFMSDPDCAWNIYGVEALVDVAGITGSTIMQLNNGANDILDTDLINIDTGEYRSIDAATQPVINQTYRSLSGIIFLDVDIDDISTTPAENVTIMIHVGRP